MDTKNKILMLEDLEAEHKKAEAIIDSNNDENVSEDYKRGLKKGLMVSLEKALEISMECEVEEYDLENMPSPSRYAH